MSTQAHKPPRSILDPAFVYVPAARTDIRETFTRVRNEMQAAALQKANGPRGPVVRMPRINRS